MRPERLCDPPGLILSGSENCTQLTANISAADVGTAGTASVTVFNPSPGGGTSNAQPFTVNVGYPIYLPLIRRWGGETRPVGFPQ